MQRAVCPEESGKILAIFFKFTYAVLMTHLTLETLPLWRQAQREQGRRLILTNGCFDILHIGHVRYLQAAREHGDLLLVGVNADVSVRALKGETRPINQEQDRAELLRALRCVDATFIFSEHTADALIEAVVPDAYIKAGDYTRENLPETPTLDRLGVEILFMPFVAGYSTTRTLAKAQDAPKP